MTEYQAIGSNNFREHDVAVIGAGMGGLGACILLAQAGLRVICVEPEPFPHARVGESLDWSTPALLRDLGLQPDLLVRDHVATKKKKIEVLTQRGSAFKRSPNSWLIRKLSNMREDTLHVDRVALDQRIFEAAQTLGVTFLWDRVLSIETEDDRVMACSTARGRTIEAPWFIDASGKARLVAKAFSIPIFKYGRQKVCIWTYVDMVSDVHGTTFYTDPQAAYLSWIWEIPVTPWSVSLGYVAAADEIRQRRRYGQSAEHILTSELAKFSRFADILEQHPALRVRTTTFQGYVSDRASGPNWLLVGEAAAMADPLTGNGVTAALRHAHAASVLIRNAQGKTVLSAESRHVYDASTRVMADVYNQSIEEALYEWPLRLGLGTKAAVTIYVFVGFFANVCYSRFVPHSRSGLLVLQLWLVCMRLWIASWNRLGRVACRARQRLADRRFEETIPQ